MIHQALKRLISWWNFKKKSNWKDDSAFKEKGKDFPFHCEIAATSGNEFNYINVSTLK